MVSSSPKLELKGGKAGKAILREAGEDLQDRICAKYTKGITIGGLAEVDGGRMKCDLLFLTALPGWNAADHDTKKVYFTRHCSTL